jgi:prepilin-type N-terminal cleavage/methylation domain-containing protein
MRANKIHISRVVSGFTLIEIIIVIVVLTIVSIFGFSFLSNAAQTYFAMKNQGLLFNEAATAMERMSREIRDCYSISTPTAGNNGNKIRVYKAHATPQDANLYVTFALNGTTLQRGSNTVDADPAAYNNLAANCSSFSVTNTLVNNVNEILLTLTLSQATGGTVTVQTKIYPKNLPFGAVSYGGRSFNTNWFEVIT